MNIIVITGICGSGKTYLCKDKVFLSYDKVFSYQTNNLNFQEIDDFFESNKKCKEIFLDAFSPKLITYIRDKYQISNITCKLLYTNLDDIYDCIAIKEPRTFNQEKYDDYIHSIKTTINYIRALISESNFNDIKYLFRNKDIYIEHNNSNHLEKILTQSKKDRLLEFVDKTSGSKNYQSILLDNEYIRRGSEKDWITLENVLKCTTLKNKIICDTGCFNGYFSFQSLKNGAKKVIGIDHNEYALNICKKIAIYNNLHLWKDGKLNDVSCERGISFYHQKIGKDLIFTDEKINPPIDVIYVFNYLHHLKNELGLEAFKETINIFFKNANEIIFEVNENEMNAIQIEATNNNFKLMKQIESHRKTSFGNRVILYYKKINMFIYNK